MNSLYEHTTEDFVDIPMGVPAVALSCHGSHEGVQHQVLMLKERLHFPEDFLKVSTSKTHLLHIWSSEMHQHTKALNCSILNVVLGD